MIIQSVHLNRDFCINNLYSSTVYNKYLAKLATEYAL